MIDKDKVSVPVKGSFVVNAEVAPKWQADLCVSVPVKGSFVVNLPLKN